MQRRRSVFAACALLVAILLQITGQAHADDLPAPGQLIRHQQWVHAERFARDAARYAQAIDSRIICPVASAQFVSSFGAPRVGHTHAGNDLMAPDGTVIVAPQSGVYRRHGNDSFYLDAQDGTEWFGTHLQGHIAPDGPVTAGQPIALVGHSGNASPSAPHLHLERHPNAGPAVDPYPVLDAACHGQPVPTVATPIEASGRRYYPAPRPTYRFGVMETHLYVNSFRPVAERIDRPTAARIAAWANAAVAAYLRALTPSCTPGDVAGCERLVRTIASRYGVDPNAAVSVARCESGLSPTADNGSFAGLYQQMKSAWAGRASSRGFGGRSVYDPTANASVSMMMVREDGGWRQWSCQP